MEIFNKKGKVKHGLRRSLWDKREESIARNGDERDPWRSTESEKFGGGVWATVEVCDWNHLLCVCVCVYQSVKGFGQSPCLRSFTKKGHITDSMNISSCYYNAHSLFNFSHVWAESHHLCVLYTEKHTCLLQKHVIRQRFSFFFFNVAYILYGLSGFHSTADFPEKITVSLRRLCVCKTF